MAKYIHLLQYPWLYTMLARFHFLFFYLSTLLKLSGFYSSIFLYSFFRMCSMRLDEFSQHLKSTIFPQKKELEI